MDPPRRRIFMRRTCQSRCAHANEVRSVVGALASRFYSMTAPLRFLVVDDERHIRRAVAHILEPLGGEVREAETGRETLTLAAAASPTLIILDLGLPDMDGTEVCRELRRWSGVAILVLTARHDEQATIAALDAGADDYVTKPFSPPQLLARVRALLRRVARDQSVESGGGHAVIDVGNVHIDLAARTVEKNGARVRLTPTEWELLATLASNAGRVMTHQQLFTTVWKGRLFGDAQAHLRVHVAHLRRKLEEDPVRPRFLQTELGVGYRFVAD